MDKNGEAFLKKQQRNDATMTPATILPIVISICAAALTAYGLYSTRRHHRLSVTPHLDDCTNKLILDAGFTFFYEITNGGIGPAKIKYFEFSRNGKVFERPVSGYTHYTEHMIQELLGNKFTYEIKYSFSYKNGGNSCLKAGATQRIAEVFFPGVKKEWQESILRAIEGIKLRIEYESFYGDPFVFDSNID